MPRFSLRYRPDPRTITGDVYRYLLRHKDKHGVVSLATLNERYGTKTVHARFKPLRERYGMSITPLNPGSKDGMYVVQHKRAAKMQALMSELLPDGEPDEIDKAIELEAEAEYDAEHTK